MYDNGVGGGGGSGHSCSLFISYFYSKQMKGNLDKNIFPPMVLSVKIALIRRHLDTAQDTVGRTKMTPLLSTVIFR